MAVVLDDDLNLVCASSKVEAREWEGYLLHVLARGMDGVVTQGNDVFAINDSINHKESNAVLIGVLFVIVGGSSKEFDFAAVSSLGDLHGRGVEVGVGIISGECASRCYRNIGPPIGHILP